MKELEKLLNLKVIKYLTIVMAILAIIIVTTIDMNRLLQTMTLDQITYIKL